MNSARLRTIRDTLTIATAVVVIIGGAAAARC
jgi:hypothetical protein